MQPLAGRIPRRATLEDVVDPLTADVLADHNAEVDDRRVHERARVPKAHAHR